METTPKIRSRQEAIAVLEANGFTFLPETAEWTDGSFTGALCHSPNPADLDDRDHGVSWWLQSPDFRRYPIL